MRSFRLDTTDRAILRELQINARITNAELAERVGLSPSACFRRLRILEDTGAIEDYTILLASGVSNRSQSVFVQMTLRSQESQDLEEFEKRVAQNPQVMECYLMSGEFDYLLRVIVSDTSDYEQLHRDFLTRLPGVERVHSSFALRTVSKRINVPLG